MCSRTDGVDQALLYHQEQMLVWLDLHRSRGLINTRRHEIGLILLLFDEGHMLRAHRLTWYSVLLAPQMGLTKLVLYM